MHRFQQLLRSLPALAFMLLLGWMSLIHPEWILQLGIINIVCGALLLLVFMNPQLVQKPLTELPTVPTPIWFTQLLIAQLGFLLLGLSTVMALTSDGPTYVSRMLTADMALGIIQDSAFKQWGLFPWGIYGFWALVILYVAQHKQGQPYFYQIALKLSPKWCEPLIKSVVSTTCMGSIMMAIGLTLASAILLFARLGESLLNTNHLALPGITTFVFYVGIIIFGLGFGRRLLRRAQSWQGVLPKLSIILCTSFVIGLLIASYLNRYIVTNHPEMAGKMICHECVKYFQNITLETRFTSLYLGWGLIWAPLVGPYIANISRGRSVREILVGLFALPVLLGLMLWVRPDIFMQLIAWVQTLNLAWVGMILGIVSFVILGVMLRKIQRIAWFYCGDYLPDCANQSRYGLKEGPRLISMTFILQRFGLTTILILFLHTLTGWLGIQIQLSILGLSVMLVIMMGIICLIGQWIRDKTLIEKSPVPENSPE